MPDRRPASRLRLTRVAKGWRIGALAEAIDVAESTIRRLEVGLTEEPSDRVRRALARKLGISAAKLFGTGK
jgi:transcriptional regulator with XRE-family HTH domain